MKYIIIPAALFLVMQLLQFFRSSGVDSITPIEAQKLLNDKQYVFLDVRTDSEYMNAHIPGSKHVPLNTISENNKDLFEIKNKKIIAYCRSGNRSLTATKMLSTYGFEVKNMSGGMMRWQGKTSSGKQQ